MAHAEKEECAAALQQISQTGSVDARGVTISSALLHQLLGAVPRDSEGLRVIAGALFTQATFTGDARFDQATFAGDAVFDRATFAEGRIGGEIFRSDVRYSNAGFGNVTFQRKARFAQVTFTGDADFGQVTFTGDADFGLATFTGDADFGRATFAGDAGFAGASFTGDAAFAGARFQRGARFGKVRFQRDARFGNVKFQRDARFGQAAFTGNAWFNEATFRGDAGFSGTTFGGDAGFSGVTFQRNAVFRSAAFGRAQVFGPVLAFRGLDFDAVQFTLPAVIEASTTALCCRRAQFPAGVQLRLRWAQVVLDDTDLSAPSLVTGIPRLASYDLAVREQRIMRAWTRLDRRGTSEQPRLLSLQRANVAALGLSNVSLAGCRFAGAHNLDLLRLDADITLGLSPARAGWERRQVIAEEAEWRAGRRRPGRWAVPPWPAWAGERPAALEAGTIAGLYRALRKGREDAKDEPGAADFYYGEMEMRRHADRRADQQDSGSRGRVDRSVLTVYWLVSGYGLRAWRALAAFAAVITAFALAFHLAGFISPPKPASYWTSLLYAFRSTLSLSDDAVNLTNVGQLLQALLRLTGPVLLGLALLALRGRVRR